ncbi:MAG TPA: hypothetical protein VMC84_03920 [Methanocella sp.]|uniref:hypothetical protein n=1 Tax=Methanocella sp. TaxID=2052833 RepID=UPI002C468CDD|nr:hypothetical protein [Methanocella sp.]HTY90301.1 hypothetical protein [Methanocella sp.]
MPLKFDTIFFSKGEITYRLHFPYILGDVRKSMLLSDDDGKFSSDTREYFIKGYTYGSATYDIHVKEIGADIFPGRIDALFTKGDNIEPIPLDFLENIRTRKEEATQNRIAITVNGKPV